MVSSRLRLAAAAAAASGLALAAIVMLGGVSAAKTATGTVAPWTAWLCRPGQRPDPCTTGLATTVYNAKLSPTGVQRPKATSHPGIDCFYVYPTVSDQKTGNSNLRVDPEERSIALYQAARFSQYCRVYAPVYRQVTPAGFAGRAKGNTSKAYTDVVRAFATYLAYDNHRRGFVLIGDGQGAIGLRGLIHSYIDPHPVLRRLLVSAVLLGADVLVKQGTASGGDFTHIPACRNAAQIGCVIAFSSFDQPVPRATLFGRATHLQSVKHHEAVLCTNPAGLGGSTGRLKPIFPSRPFAPGVFAQVIAASGLTQPRASTAWVSEASAYRARCVTSNQASVLEVTPVGGAQAPRPSPTPAFGLHYIETNLVLGNLVTIVGREAQAYARQLG